MSIPISYRIGTALYHLALYLYSFWNTKAKERVTGYRSTFDILSRFNKKHKAPRIWIHASSVGEYDQCIPLIDLIKDQLSDHDIILSVYSPSVFNYLKKGDRSSKLDLVIFLPPDTSQNAQALVELINPNKVLWAKYDFWFHYMQAIAHRQIPFYLISGIFRKDQLYFKSGFSGWGKQLNLFTHLFVQDEKSKELLASIDIAQATVVGDTRLDRVIDRKKYVKPLPKIEAFKDGKELILLASVHRSDMEVIKEAIENRTHGKLLIVPHDMDEAFIGQVASMAKAARWTTIDDAGSVDILILDTVGLLFESYAYADAVYVGGGFGTGIHNILEPLVFSLPISIGPQYKKFKEAVDLVDLGLVKVLNHQKTINKYISPEDTERYILENVGAVKMIQKHIFNPDK